MGFHRVPVRHAMTVGELAEMIHQERAIGCRLEIVPLENWQRGDFFDATGLLWVNPSPNMRNLNAALLYPGIGLLETTNLSVGRGTDTPFELIGAPWMKPARVAARLNAAALPGVRFVPRFFTPDASKFRGQRCGGVQILITDRNAFRPLRTGFEVARALRETHRDDWQLAGYRRLLGHDATFQGLEQGREFGQLEQLYADELQDFLARRARYLKY